MNKNRIRLTESQLHKVIKESVKRILKESNQNTEIWYRGYNSKYPNFGSPKGLWLVDNIEYAHNYAKQFGKDGKIAEIKLNLNNNDITSIFSFPDSFDGYDQNDLYGDDDELREYVQELRQEGAKGYSLPQDDGECIFLWDLSPIVSSRDLTDEEIKNALSW